MLREVLTAKLSSFEGKERVDEWMWNGWRAWPAVRTHVALWLHASARSRVSQAQPLRLVASLRSRRQRLERWFSHQRQTGSRPDRAADVVFVTTTDRAQRLDGHLYNTVVDPWVEEVERTGHRASVWDLGAPRAGTHPTHVGVQYAIDAARRSAGRSPSPPQPLWFGPFAHFLHDELDENFSWEEIHRHLESVDQHAALFEAWLQRAEPRAVVLDCWYTPEKLGAALAAHRLGIPSIDLQHGVQGHAHPAYSGWSRCAPGRYEVMPAAFWVWGEWDAESLVAANPGAIARDSVRVVGHRWLCAWAAGETPRHCAEMRAAERLVGAAHSVLVTLQAGVPYRESLRSLVVQAPRDWRWLVRLHRSMSDNPSALERELRREVGPNVEVVQSTALPLYALLRVCAAHLTGFSTCALEALPFGVPTVLTHESGDAAYAEFIQAGVMHRFESAESATERLGAADPELAERCRRASRRVFAEPAQGGPWSGDGC